MFSAIAGLAGITPASGYIGVDSAIVISVRLSSLPCSLFDLLNSILGRVGFGLFLRRHGPQGEAPG